VRFIEGLKAAQSQWVVIRVVVYNFRDLDAAIRVIIVDEVVETVKIRVDILRYAATVQEIFSAKVLLSITLMTLNFDVFTIFTLYFMQNPSHP
jgi:hypothetical protein